MAKQKTAAKKNKASAAGNVVTTLAGERIPAAELGHVAPDLWPLVVAVDSLTPDPRNARVHNAQNFDAIARSLNDNGQLKALSTDADGVVLAGNGTLAAAKSLGWRCIARVRCNLTGAAAAGVYGPRGGRAAGLSNTRERIGGQLQAALHGHSR